ncbi:MAG: C1 family peptidase [Acidobacteriota bacterium]|jgi:bleomycin hydrolase
MKPRKLITMALVPALLGAFTALPALAGTASGPAGTASKEAELTPALIKNIQDTFKMTPQMKAMQNALAQHKIRSLAVNREMVNQTDDLFTHVIKNPGSITNQKSSGRCWLFAGLNIMRPGVIATHKMKGFTLSQAYEQFWDRMEHANLSLQLAMSLRKEPLDSRRNQLLLQNLIGDGGDWTFVTALIDKYGVVPQSLMPDTYSASHTGTMDMLLATRLRQAILKMRAASKKGASMADLQQIKTDTLKSVYKILVLCLGQPPQTFKWRYETKDGKVTPYESYTPKSFYAKFVGMDLKNYVAFVNYPGKPEHARLEWEWYRGMEGAHDVAAVNVSAADLAEMCRKSVMADEAVWFASNASAPGDIKNGLWADGVLDYSAIFGMHFDMNKKDTLETYEGAPNHAMVFTGVDIRDGKPDKWKVENSWGTKPGKSGWFIITQGWFNKHVYEVIINKKYVPKNLLELQHQKPIMLPPWDPFSYD